MQDIQAYVESGILELYVLGTCTEAEAIEAKRLSQLYPEILSEIERIENQLLEIPPPQAQKRPTLNVKAMVLAIADYTHRLANGEVVSNPPLLNAHSKKDDFAEWLQRSDMILPSDADDAYAKIIGYTEKAATLIVWLKTGSPYEVHEAQLERFFILEGSCKIAYANGETHDLNPGDFIEIPLFMGHTLTVTSNIPCKVILQRVAA